ncbi:MAG: hypothetical protein KAS67_06765 [Thermoplasmata archaeon]|nr:hypothetical protein [Thermoplasmata archaeon]
MSFLRVHFRTFVHATESEDKVREALAYIAGDTEIEATRTDGHFGNPIIILEAAITRKREIKDFFISLKNTGIIEKLLEEIDDRMDEHCNLHFRVDKDIALEEKIVLARGKNVIDISLKTAAYPANRENALVAARDFLNALI